MAYILMSIKTIKMRERAIKRILDLTDKYSRKELENIKDTLDLAELSFDVEKIMK